MLATKMPLLLYNIKKKTGVSPVLNDIAIPLLPSKYKRDNYN
jgi:hypothetical protein